MRRLLVQYHDMSTTAAHSSRKSRMDVANTIRTCPRCARARQAYGGGSDAVGHRAHLVGFKAMTVLSEIETPVEPPGPKNDSSDAIGVTNE